MNRKVSIIMGSDSDLPTMKEAALICEEFGVEYEMRVVSAHRTPHEMIDYGTNIDKKGIRVIIAGAGGAAHLPGMIASTTHLPVIGVPIQTKTMSGLDSLYSIVQMPPGIPVATVAIGAGKNAGILAISILATSDSKLADKLVAFKKEMAEVSRRKNDNEEFTSL